MALTPLQRQRRKNEINDRFNEYKSVGTTLMQLGKITPEEYYSRVRNKGIQFGVIRPDEYPDDLPGWVQDKVTTAEDRLQSAHDYMLYKIWRMENDQ